MKMSFMILEFCLFGFGKVLEIFFQRVCSNLNYHLAMIRSYFLVDLWKNSIEIHNINRRG